MERSNLNIFACNHRPLSHLVFVLLVIMCLRVTECESVFTVYPLADDYFQKIYVVQHQNQKYYLTISCKQRNMLSLSITKQKQFQQAPRFNIYGNAQIKPKMARGVYTFLQECRVHVQVNTDNFLEVRRNKDSQIIFAISQLNFQNLNNRFIVKDQSTKWGFGQRFQRKFSVADGLWTIWNRDKPWMIDDGRAGSSQQTYGHHPVYLARERQSRLYHFVYYKNTHGMLIESSKNSDSLIFNSVGGNVHFIIILGQQNPQDVLQKYHQYIGTSHIPPFWSMGYHQSRWGYKNLNDIKEVVAKFNQNSIPIDTMWSDLQYMQRKKIFTINQGTHPSKQFNEFLEKEAIHFVPLIDVGVSVDDQPAMKMGKEMNVYLKHPKNQNQYYTGEVWPGVVHFVDYLHPNATTFWKNQLGRLYQKIKFSGIWLDMNQPSNFRGGENVNQPFRIQQNQNINTMTINVELKHYTESKYPLQHREVHAYFGHLSTVPTHQFLAQNGRAFIISRSSSVGSGHFAGHWTGDNVANWDFLRLSINGNFLFQIFGTQIVGADICGFYRDTTEQLCSRWMQLGTFYPFSRNHNHQQSKGQQPYQFGQTLLQTSKISIRTRYALLKQFYTTLLQKKGKGSFFRPLTFQFFNDEDAYVEQVIETEFLIGKYLLVAPIVTQGADSREVYFPGQTENWSEFTINSQSGKVNEDSIKSIKGKSRVVIKNSLPACAPTFLRQGYAIMTNQPAKRSAQLSSSFHLFASLKNNQSFAQMLGIDDFGKEVHIQKCIKDNCLFVFNIKRQKEGEFKLTWNYIGDQQIIGSLKIESWIVVSGDKIWRGKQSAQVKGRNGEVTVKLQLKA